MFHFCGRSSLELRLPGAAQFRVAVQGTCAFAFGSARGFGLLPVCGCRLSSSAAEEGRGVGEGAQVDNFDLRKEVRDAGAGEDVCFPAVVAGQAQVGLAV